MNTKPIPKGQLKTYIQAERAKGRSPQEIVQSLVDQGQATLISPSENPEVVDQQIAAAIAKLENRQQ